MASGSGASRQGPWGMIMLAACLGTALVLLAVPRIVAYGPLISFGPVRAALDQVAMLDLHRLELSTRLWVAAGPVASGTRLLILRDRAAQTREQARCRIVGDAEMTFEFRQLAVADLNAAAAAAPFDAFAWALLADARIDAGKAPEEILPALRLARLTGPGKASAILLQHGIVMRHWATMPDKMRAHAMADVAVFWRRAPYRPFLLESYLDAGFAARAAFRRALAADDPRLLDHLDRMLVGDAARRKR